VVSRNGLIATLDVGSSKVCCFIARADGGTLRVIGIGHQLSRGLRNGNVIDMDAAEQSIRAAVETAERMCGETIRDVFISVNTGAPQSHTVGVEVAIDGHEVTDHDVALVLDHGRRHEHPSDREIIHSIPVGYTIDGSRGIKDPRGMACERLGVPVDARLADELAAANAEGTEGFSFVQFCCLHSLLLICLQFRSMIRPK